MSALGAFAVGTPLGAPSRPHATTTPATCPWRQGPKSPCRCVHSTARWSMATRKSGSGGKSARRRTSPSKASDADPSKKSAPASEEQRTSPPAEQIDASKPLKNPTLSEADGEDDEQKDIVAEPVNKFKRKSAEEFAAEGIEDDVRSGVRFESITEGIVDDSDPFKADEQERIAKEDDEDAEDNTAAKAPIDVTSDGSVVKEVLVKGSGPKVEPKSSVSVHYVGMLDNGKVFDSSRKRGGPFECTVATGEVIRGWDAALVTMRVGEKAKVSVKPNYAYGRKGVPPIIPPNAKLIFEIEVVDAEVVKESKTFADDNPDIPRTADDIANAYLQKMVEKRDSPEKKGFFDRFYFISPFKSQTGERPPWWLNPNITFVLVFLFVFAGFYIVYKSGGVHVGYLRQTYEATPFE